MINFLIIGICLLMGWLVKWLKVLPEGSHKGINAWIIYVALPAATLKYVPAIHWDFSVLLPALMPLIVWFGAWAIAKSYNRISPLDKKTEAALIITTGLGNTSFLGFPLIQAYYGDQWLSIAAISDQVTFALLSTVAAVTAIKASGKGNSDFKGIAGKLVGFPPFIALAAALMLPHFFSFTLVEPLFGKLASTIAPLALFSVGLQMHFEDIGAEMKHLSVALGYKLLLAPAIILLIGMLLHLNVMNTRIAVFEAAVAPMITAGILAVDYGLNPRLSNLIVSMGILLSFFSTAGWYLLMEKCF